MSVALENGSPFGEPKYGYRPEECMSQCNTQSNCNSFTYCVLDKYCYLYEKVFNGSEITKTSGNGDDCTTYYHVCGKYNNNVISIIPEFVV